jgi:hypothetical protein
MRRYGVVLVSAVGFLMSGCMVGPRYLKPTFPVTPNFAEAQASKEGDGWKVAQPDGVDTYLQVVTSQTTALANERNDIDILRRRLEANVLLIKAMGGGWNISNLPQL